jgi:hypothetical protein
MPQLRHPRPGDPPTDPDYLTPVGVIAPDRRTEVERRRDREAAAFRLWLDSDDPATGQRTARPLLPVNIAAGSLGLSRDAMYRWCRSGCPFAVKVGLRGWRIVPELLDAYRAGRLS